MFQADLLFQTVVTIMETDLLLNSHLQLLVREGKSYIKVATDFLERRHSLPNLPDDIILCSVDVVGFYHNIPHDKGLSSLRKHLGLRLRF